MPVNLNLLPTELSASKNLGKFLKTTRALGVIAAVAFLIFGIGTAIFFLVSKVTLDSLNVKVNALKSQVSAQEKTEQEIILLKDRLTKIASIQKLPNSLINLKAVDPVLANLSDSTTVSQMLINPSGVNLSLNIKTNSDLRTFLSSIQNSEAFNAVNLASFGLSPTTGYSLEVQITTK